MEKYAYEILISTETPQGPFWTLVSNGQQLGPNLLLALNKLGSAGWEMVGTADIGRTSREEIFLKKRIA
ncbi:MAG: hypothetical protein AABN33_05995 [Acidobacteriota bacterium]